MGQFIACPMLPLFHMDQQIRPNYSINLRPAGHLNFTESQSHKDTNVTISLYYCIYIFTVIPCNLYIYVNIAYNYTRIYNIYIHLHIHKASKKTVRARNLVPVLGDFDPRDWDVDQILRSHSSSTAPLRALRRHGALHGALRGGGSALDVEKKAKKTKGLSEINVYICVYIIVV
jgi:hypothetical protein